MDNGNDSLVLTPNSEFSDEKQKITKINSDLIEVLGDIVFPNISQLQCTNIISPLAVQTYCYGGNVINISKDTATIPLLSCVICLHQLGSKNTSLVMRTNPIMSF